MREILSRRVANRQVRTRFCLNIQAKTPYVDDFLFARLVNDGRVVQHDNCIPQSASRKHLVILNPNKKRQDTRLQKPSDLTCLESTNRWWQKSKRPQSFSTVDWWIQDCRCNGNMLKWNALSLARGLGMIFMDKLLPVSSWSLSVSTIFRNVNTYNE